MSGVLSLNRRRAIQSFLCGLISQKEKRIITKEQAIKIASEYLNSDTSDLAMEIVILEDYIIEKSYGWIFIYDTQKHLLTGDISDTVVGGPVVVERINGKLHPLGTAFPLEEEIRRFEQRTGLNNQT